MLTADDPPAVRVFNPKGRASFLLLGDHAGRAIPAALGTLGLGEADLDRHIGWDIGVGAVGEALASALDAVFVRQTYSRLVIDCNRDPDRADAIPAISDGTVIAGNENLTPGQRRMRIEEVHSPYQRAIAEMIARREAEGRETILIALHSFTPWMLGFDRPWDIGVLHAGGDTRFATSLLAALRDRPDLVVGDNQPYAMDDVDHTIPVHAYPDRRLYAEIEIRQDHLADPEGVGRWCAILADTFAQAAEAKDRPG
ncbi:N-formylglutamate amidohydrolase [Sphingosinicella rhizophila]|uniref:N-formylglutamate amidohydrolase n=1 Tax=Sphingosinicella rhizophila TaxID=3050082 RepID=A0ABU3QA47_9SPHN|nr:N-formylglutamate amidohydrolase [Sphingosinicella sp. GR2756]MDT9600277.1 N-formylglutamate amidohydrolase [Sphingosinicella sp. GR2756]